MKFLKYLTVPFLFFCFLEICLRYIGFGDPVLYIKSKNNYFPKSNQEKIRYKGVNIKINKLGMRTNYNWDHTNDKNKIIFFGDSVTYGGSYIDNKDLFSEKVCGDYLKNSICGNYGVNGYSIENIHLRINELDKKYYDQLIIVVSSQIENNLSSFNNFPFYINFDYFFFKASFEILNHFMFKYNIYDAYHEKEKNDLNNKKETKKVFFEEFLNNISDETNIMIFILPTIEDLNKKKKKKNFIELYKLKKIKIINLYDEILQSEYKNIYFNNAHLNQKGHDQIAKIIYEYIK